MCDRFLFWLVQKIVILRWQQQNNNEAVSGRKNKPCNAAPGLLFIFLYKQVLYKQYIALVYSKSGTLAAPD